MTAMPFRSFILQMPLALVASAVCSPCDALQESGQRERAQRATSIRWLPAKGGENGRVVVDNIPAAQLAALKTNAADARLLKQAFSLFVAGENNVVVLGTTRLEGERIVFVPRYPLKKGLEYRAVLDLSNLADSADAAPATGSPTAATIRIPAESPSTPPATVEAVYPSADELPENLLRFYIHFSQPMGRGGNYRYIRLLDAEGRPIPYPFLELGEELWDPDQRRFTLLFDPGRVKRELYPNKEVGSPLLEGRSYTLEIDAEWRDARGRPMLESFRKHFRVTVPDATQPDPDKWQVTTPVAGSREPLVVRFPEPVDHAMLQRSLGVVDAQGDAVAGSVTVSKGEQRWQFEPRDVWQAGDYSLLADVNLEDWAGNSIERPFEVDVLRPVQKQIVVELRRIAFTVDSE